ncbi:MAG TPA: dienelactone hydrolase family protein [Tepidisphaeraceae bacterium]|jgi:predicted esterase|nr:dienelactone hydrolase family protein [Tepidisphaeraceae bacterium]
MKTLANDPHANAPIFTRGPAPEMAKAVLVMVHGRGASADSILSLYDVLDLPQIAAVAPEANGNTWYPQSFLAPLPANQPFLDSALNRIATVVDDLIARGVPSERIALLGFSQGACLTTEFVARHPRRYGAVMGLTGGLIGPQGTPRDYPGSLAGTPVFLGCGDPDMHIPFERVLETEAVFRRMGANVETRRYPGRPHTVSQDELEACRELLTRLVS